MFKKVFFRILLLFVIIFIAGFLRFWDLGKNPPSLTWDEVSWGYNAYSIGIDGKDEFGRLLPIDYLESFGDFKPPVYAYLDVLPVKIFGLNEFAVRFPSAFFGVLTVLVTYFLTKRIFQINPKSEIRNPKERQTFKQIQNSNNQNPKHWKFEIGNLKFGIPEVASLLLAISPWHINLSRAAFEANVATFFIVIGVWAFLAGVQNKKWYVVISAVSFVLSIYTFNTARVVSPLLVLILGIGFRKELFERKKETIVAAVIGCLIVLPVIPFLLSPQANLRFREVNIFTNIDVIKRINQQIENDGNAFWSKIIHNRRFAYGVEFLNHYFDNFSSEFLFIKGDGNPKFSTQDIGQMYLWELPFLIIGVLMLFRKREGYWWIIPLWLILAIFPAATARETPHALRIETTLPTFQILTAYGVLGLLYLLSRYKYLLTGILAVLVVLSLFYYLYEYYAHYPFLYSREWQYGYKESIAYVEKVKEKYDQIYITMDLGRPYIYYLFYTKTNPIDFRKTAIIKRDVFGFVAVEGFDKYKFPKDLNSNKAKNSLFVGTTGQIPSNASILKSFNTLDGSQILAIYTIKTNEK